MATRIEYDVSKMSEPDGPKRLRRRDPAEADATPPDDVEPGSFAARVRATRVDLVSLVEKGLPPLSYVAASEGMLVRGKRHLLAAEKKEGKSIATLNHAIDIALAGEGVAILDRENGSDTYARRLADMFDARTLKKSKRQQVQKRLAYYEFPKLRPKDADDLIAEFGDCALVVFDSQRMYMSDFGLAESDADDYAQFMAYAVDPLFRGGVATLILDNAGHTNPSRSRGTSAKGDLNEVMFSLKAELPFDFHRTGLLRLTIEHTRFGNRGEWTMDLGGGRFGSWVPTEVTAVARDDFREAVLAELADGAVRGVDKLTAAARSQHGVKISNTAARALLNAYADGPETLITRTTKGFKLRKEPA